MTSHGVRTHGVLAALAWGIAAPLAAASPSALSDGPGKLWIHRTLGAAYFDAGSDENAAIELAAAAALAPDSAPDARNAGIAALGAGDLDAASTALEKAASLDSTDAVTAYALALVALRAGDPTGARAQGLRCRALGGNGPELEYHLGLAALRLGDLPTAASELSAVVARGPTGAPRLFVPALDRWGRVLLALGHTSEGNEALRRARERKAGGDAVGDVDLGGGLLALATFPAPPDVRAAGFLPAFTSEPLPGGEIRWAESADLDRDGDRDLLLGDGQTLRDLRRDGSRWIDVTSSRGLAGLLGVATARALDVDDDGQLDLVRAGGGGLAIHPGVEGAWGPPRPAGVEPVTRFAPLDVDRDGDVDLVTAGARRPSLLRNRGDGSFEDVAQEAGLASVGPSVTVVAGDLDDDGDPDLVFVTRRGEIVAATNSRGGLLEVRPAVVGAPAGAFDVAVGDLDGDGDLDLAAVAPRGVFALENRGALSLEATRDPVLPGTVRWPASGASSVWIVDLDADGRSDLVAAAETGALLGLNAGDTSFPAAPELLRPLASAGAFPVAVALVDPDARLDLVTSRGACGLARNVGRTGAAVVLHLRGTEACKDAVGAVVELDAGSRTIRRDAAGGCVHLGVGADSVDALRVRWTNGLRQPVRDVPAGVETEIVESAGPVGAGPLVFSWDGERFAFIGDVLSRACLGKPAGVGAFAPPAKDAPLRIAPSQLRADGEGFLTLQLTEERREVAYLDELSLFAVDHPESVDVPAFEWPTVHVLDHPRTPLRAVDSAGRDVADRLVVQDGLCAGASDASLDEATTLELDFGDVPPDAKLTLHLAGWHSETSSSERLAIAQDPQRTIGLPRVAVPGTDGGWAPWPAEISLPGGATRSIAVDVSGAFAAGRARLRVTSTSRVFWDRVALQVGESPAQTTVTPLPVASADLHERGWSQALPGAAETEPVHLEYETLSAEDVPWDPAPGTYTRAGDVLPLLQEVDDRFVILATGDECTLRFRADGLPELPAGRARTYFLALDGWVKDGDPNTAHGDRVEPLPFHAMSGYPYRADETFPDDDLHRAYRAEWNTRPAQPGAATAQPGAATSPSDPPPPATAPSGEASTR